MKSWLVIARKLILPAVALSLVVSAGCGSPGSDPAVNSSVGQQLLDLDKAYQNGTVTKKEYESLRKAIIKKNQ